MGRTRMMLMLVVAALATPVHAQDWRGIGRMEGKVLDESGAPLGGVTVKATLPERQGETTLKTDKKGHWVLGGIAAGTWDFDFQLDGYVTKQISVKLPSESSRLAPVEVKLEKAAPVGPPPEVKAAIEKAEAAFQERRFPEARAEFERLLAIMPAQAATIHQRIGLCYYAEKNYKEALPHLEQALAAQPDNVQIRVIAAQAALGGGMTDRGRELLAGIDENTIKNPDVFFNIGLDFLGAGNTAEAVRYFTKAIAVDPKDVDAYYQRGLGYVNLGKMEDARTDFKKILELAPTGQQADMAKKALEQIK
ncbi:MAG TPA: tetratricopeptide repeat protein [Vicinamibacteria bacterium]|jgi:tetratricopeptide (TPR) repeat protein|nr:tetratricopeptide repeat protein [Vicinamibacteria bacterium]